ncbi:helix-turn-helix domain-containing protein [Azohydromonas australica]|uniref:helix-turn-helix domain-containing protein n=1 Tax=Azohydromonas australica TaxID=364039 RepID=UPI000A028C1B|nr:helix-turn-helix domain-containing protein [Azohydromonas australica]
MSLARSDRHERSPQNRAALHNMLMATKLLVELSEEDKSLIPTCVVRLMERHGVPKKKRASLLAETLGLSRVNGYRRLSGAYQMPMDEVAVIAKRFGEPLNKVLAPVLTVGMEPALMQVSEMRIPCLVELGPPAGPPFSCDFVALGAPGNWVIVPATGIPIQAREVQRLLITCESKSSSTGGSMSEE